MGVHMQGARSLTQPSGLDGQVVGFLVQAGADVNFADPYNSGITPLMKAADMGRLSIVRALLRSNASIFRVDYEGQTVLEWAVGHGKLGVVRLLLDMGGQH